MNKQNYHIIQMTQKAIQTSAEKQIREMTSMTKHVLPTILIVFLFIVVHLIISIYMEIRSFTDKDEEWKDKVCWFLSIVVTFISLFLLIFKLYIPIRKYKDDVKQFYHSGPQIFISLIIIILLLIHLVISVLMDIRAFKDNQEWKDKTGWTLSIVVIFLSMILMFFMVMRPMYRIQTMNF